MVGCDSPNAGTILHSHSSPICAIARRMRSSPFKPAENFAQLHSVQGGVQEGTAQVYAIVMLAARPAHAQHTGAAQVTNQSPNRSAGQGHPVHDLADSAVRVGGDEKEDGAVAGDQVPMIAAHRKKSAFRVLLARGGAAMRTRKAPSTKVPPAPGCRVNRTLTVGESSVRCPAGQLLMTAGQLWTVGEV